MKFTFLSSLALTGLSVAGASSNVMVYELAGEHTGACPSTPMNTALLYLADKFGVGDYYTLGHKEKATDFIDMVHSYESQRPKLLVILKGVNTPEDLLGSDQPSFQIDMGNKDKMSHHLVHTLDHKFVRQIAESFNVSQVSHLSEEIKFVSRDAKLVDHLSREFEYFKDELPGAWDRLIGATRDFNEQRQMVLENSGIKLVNDKVYISEIMQMLKLSGLKQHAPDFVVANLDSLFSIGSRIGYNSRTYSVAKKAMLASVKSLSADFDVTIVAMGPDHKIAVDMPKLSKRSNDYEKEFSLFQKRGAVATKSCFADESACKAGTNDCSGHGTCSKVQSSCWQCLCSATYDDKTSKTTKWAGFDCGKKDIAAQAHLLLWTSVALLVTLVGGIKLLSSIGNEPLPGVLEAATIDTSRN